MKCSTNRFANSLALSLSLISLKLGEYVDLDTLPEDYGGTGPRVDMDFDVDKYLDSDPYLSDESALYS